MKKQLCKWLLILTVPMLCGETAYAQQAWDGTTVDTEWEGEGTEESPYLISTPAELAGLAQRTNADETFEGKYIKLTADLSLSDPTAAADQRPLWIPIGNYGISNDDPETNPGGFYKDEHWFKGTFDGDGHTISNLWYTGTTDYEDWNDPFGSGQIDFSAWNKALFGCMDGAVIKNLRLENANIAGSSYIGGLVIMAKNSTFTDIHVGGSFKSGDIGSGGSAAAVAVMAYDSSFTRCTTEARVYAKSNTGLIVGHLNGASTVTDCTASGEVTGGVYSGGIAGSATADENSDSGATPVITNCSSSALVTVIPTRNQGDYGGGFIGMNCGTISRCYTTGNVHVLSDVGAGFVADNRGTIESCYATGDVYSEESGYTLCAFVCYNGLNAGYSEYYPGTILNCFSTGDLTAPDAPGDVITSPTHISGFVWLNAQEAGSRMANCYYDSTKNPELYAGMKPECGSYGVSTEYMQSQEFVDCLNNMAAIMGTYRWQYTSGGYPLPTDVKSAEIVPFFAGGDGTAADPFQISDKQQLKNLAFAANRNWNFTGQYIQQTADIALNAPQEEWGETMPEQWTPIAEAVSTTDRRSYRFCGKYDGGFHTVANMYIDDKDKVYSGLFGILGGGAEISNLGVTDAWMTGQATGTGIVAGAVRIHEDCDQFWGDVRFSNCWTSGLIENGVGGGIVGYVNYRGDTYLNACGSTADVSGLYLIGNATDVNEVMINGSWYAGKSEKGVRTVPSWTNFYINSDINTAYKDSSYGRTTEYMKGRQFVNDLNYAAASIGDEPSWRYRQGEYPLFTGEAPTINVTVNNEDAAPVSFPVFQGSHISKPAAPTLEGYDFVGWFADQELSEVFNFAETAIEEETNLWPSYRLPLAADYTIFKNKFAKSFTITTPAELLAFANIVNGKTTEVDQSDFSGKTVSLGNDIELNDISCFDNWGTLISPQAFPSVATNGAVFKGVFDGNGHSIRGIYQESDFYSPADYSYPGYGFINTVNAEAAVRNLILDHAFINAKSSTTPALLAVNLYGTVENCGAIGRIDGTDVSAAGLAHTVNTGAAISQSYADVELNLRRQNTSPTAAGLVYTQDGTMTDCYAVGNATIEGRGNYAGIAFYASKGFERCYAAVQFAWSPDNLMGPEVGGAYYSYNSSADASDNGYYDSNLFDGAFAGLEEMANADSFIESAKGRGIGLPTESMRMMASFPDWDFNEVWGRRNDINNGYPYLRWTNPGLENDRDSSGVETLGVSSDAEIIDWYNLDGIRIAEPAAPGIYIVRRADGTTAKVIR